jgi:hypothetical protein
MMKKHKLLVEVEINSRPERKSAAKSTSDAETPFPND